VETVEEMRKGRWKATIHRRDDGLMQVELWHWEDIEGAWCQVSTASSKTDTLEIARSLAHTLLESRTD
jgi:hypothetical protein